MAPMAPIPGCVSFTTGDDENYRRVASPINVTELVDVVVCLIHGVPNQSFP